MAARIQPDRTQNRGETRRSTKDQVGREGAGVALCGCGCCDSSSLYRTNTTLYLRTRQGGHHQCFSKIDPSYLIDTRESILKSEKLRGGSKGGKGEHRAEVLLARCYEAVWSDPLLIRCSRVDRTTRPQAEQRSTVTRLHSPR